MTSGAGTFTYSYVGNTGMVNSLTMPNGVVSSYGYTSLEQLASVTTRAGSNATDPLISSYTYAYDSRGVRTSVLRLDKIET